MLKYFDVAITLQQHITLMIRESVLYILIFVDVLSLKDGKGMESM